jgi:hypothetical protein
LILLTHMIFWYMSQNIQHWSKHWRGNKSHHYEIESLYERVVGIFDHIKQAGFECEHLGTRQKQTKKVVCMQGSKWNDSMMYQNHWWFQVCANKMMLECCPAFAKPSPPVSIVQMGGKFADDTSKLYMCHSVASDTICFFTLQARESTWYFTIFCLINDDSLSSKLSTRNNQTWCTDLHQSIPHIFSYWLIQKDAPNNWFLILLI